MLIQGIIFQITFKIMINFETQEINYYLRLTLSLCNSINFIILGKQK